MHSPFLPGVKTASTHKDDTDASSSVIQFGSQSEVGGAMYRKAKPALRGGTDKWRFNALFKECRINETQRKNAFENWETRY